MSTRYLIAALLMTSACAAHADVTTSTPAPSGILTSWTTGNGTDVVGSGVLSDNASLIGGVAYGSDASLAQALYQRASANAAQNNGIVKIAYSQGIQGQYLTSTSNAMLVAMLGDSMQAVSSPDGAIITSAGHGAANAPAGGGGSGGGGANGATNNAGTNNGNGNGSGSGSDSVTGTGAGVDMSAGLTGGAQGLGTGGQAVGAAADQTVSAEATVPEPSSLALLAAGLFGAMGLRRRTRR